MNDKPILKKIISVSNQKGGVGKTTLTINLAVSFARTGKRVLMIDLDPQGNASSGLSSYIDGGRESFDSKPSIYEVLIGKSSIAESITKTTEPNLDIIPANMNLAGAGVEIASMDFREFLLKRALDPITENYDYILIDSPPSLGLLTINGLVASDQILVPMQCEFFALEGVGQLLHVMESIKSFANPNLEVGAVILMMHDSRMKLTEAVADEIRKHFGDRVLTNVVPRNIKMVEATSYGQCIMDYAKDSRGALAIDAITNELLFGIVRQDASISEDTIININTDNVSIVCSDSSPATINHEIIQDGGDNSEETSTREGTFSSTATESAS